jgi:hypothetical protein
MNVPSELDYAGPGGETKSDNKGGLYGAMKARCALKQTIKEKLSPKRTSGA